MIKKMMVNVPDYYLANKGVSKDYVIIGEMHMI